VKKLLIAFSAIFAAVGMGRAMADEICPALTSLLTNPPAGFVALRGEKTSEVWPRWTAKPFLANAVCELRGAETDPQQELRCTVNDQATDAVATAWYKATAAAIDACLPKLPHGAQFVRKPEVSRNVDEFHGITTLWAYDGKAEKIEIELTSDHNFGHASNTMSVRYFKR
jgi:hypothetical protein